MTFHSVEARGGLDLVYDKGRGPLPFVLFSLSTAERVRAREWEGELTCQSSRSDGTEVWEILCSQDTGKRKIADSL